MAGDWIKMRVDLFEDPAVFCISERLNCDVFTTVGGLLKFWAWANKHCVDGHVDGATPRMVDIVIGKDGFAEAMQSVHWAAFDASGLLIPNFERHNGDTAKERSLKNERQARWREKKRSKTVDGSSSTDVSTDASTREEKRREEKKKERKEEPSRVALACPPDVPPQVFADWLALRKAKRAPVTQTTLDGAAAEATKAGLSLAEFLGIWCTRGSQGLQAEWLKPDEIRKARNVEPGWRREQRERVMQAVPGIAARPPQTFDVEAVDVTAKRLG